MGRYLAYTLATSDSGAGCLKPPGLRPFASSSPCGLLARPVPAATQQLSTRGPQLRLWAISTVVHLSVTLQNGLALEVRMELAGGRLHFSIVAWLSPWPYSPTEV